MALVRYNRNYTVQSGPRQPARRNPGALPDAAGAFLRGASGIHEGDMAVGRALLASNEARTKREMARAADAGRHWQDAGRIVAAAGKGLGEIADAYQRAQARKVASEIDGLEAAAEAHMIRNADAIYNAPWTEEDGNTTGGPAVKFGAVKDDFFKSEAWTNASDAAKKGAKARLDARFMVYEAKAERKQDEARRAVWQERADAKNREDGAAVAAFFGIEDNAAGTFDNKVGIAVESRKNAAMVRLGALVPELQPDGTLNFKQTRELTPEEKSAIDEDGKALVRQFRTERLKHWFAQLEDPATDADALKDAIDGEITETNYPSDDARLALERARDAAVRKHDANVAAAIARDNALADGIADKIGMGTATEEERRQYNAICAKLPDADRAAREATRQHAAEFREWQDWAQTYIAPMPQGEGATLEDAIRAIGKARKAAETLSPRAKSLAEKSLLPFRPAEDEYGKMCDGAIGVLCTLGLWNGQPVDMHRTRVILTDAVECGIIDPKKFNSLMADAQRNAESRAARASAMPGRDTGEEFMGVMRRYLPDGVVKKFMQVDPKSRALVFTDKFKPSGRYDTPEQWSDRSNAILLTMANAMQRFYALEAEGRLRPEQTLDSFVAEIMTNDENYKQMTDDAVIEAYKQNIQSLENAAALEDARRINPYFGTQYDAPRFDLLPPKRQ